MGRMIGRTETLRKEQNVLKTSRSFIYPSKMNKKLQRK